VYHRMTRPLIRYYQEKGAYVEVNGDRPAAEIFGSIMNKITNYE
jgi:adenylate kinase family enzyme